MRDQLIRAVRYSTALLFIFYFGAPAAARKSTSAATIPADLVTFTTLINRAVQAGKADGLEALAEPKVDLRWFAESGSANPDGRWRANVVKLPAPKGLNYAIRANYLVIFNSFHTCQSIGDHIYALANRSGQWRIGPEIKETDTRGFRIRNHIFHVKLNLSEATCHIADTLSLERTGTPSGPCLVRLSNNMILDSSARNGRPFHVASAPGVFAFAPPADKKFTLDITYHGKVLQNSGDYIRTTEVVLDSYWYPHIARLPSKFSLTVTVPKGWTAVTNGEPVGKKSDDTGTTYKFRNELPICYYTLDAGPYTITTRMSNGRRLSAYLLHANPDKAKRCLDTLEPALAYFNTVFSPFPFTHYEVVETDGPFGGALEGYSFATFDRSALPGAIVHELSHTWWGGILPNPYTHTQWNESFAEWSDGLFHRVKAGKPGRAVKGEHSDKDNGVGVLRSYAVPMSQAFDTSDWRDSAVGYGKGKIVLGMLEDILGQDAMLRCARAFIREHKRGEASDWPEFERAVNKETGKDYGWFFDQWINRAGAPIAKLSDVKIEKHNGSYAVTGKILQEGTPYRLPRMVVVAKMGDGNSATTEVEANGPSTDFSINCVSSPQSVLLDPDGNILMAGSTSTPNPFVWKEK